MQRWFGLAIALAALAAVELGCSSGDEPPANLTDAGTLGDASDGADAESPPEDAAPPMDAAPPARDAGTTPSPDASTIVDTCDPVAQSCTAPSTKCVIEGVSGAMCVASSPNDLALDAPCTGQDCRSGLACIRTSSVATCQKVCNFETGAGCEALGSEHECRTRVTDTNWGACVLLPPLCNALTQAPCAQTEACAPLLRRTGAWELRCRPAGPQAEGQPCGSSGGGLNCQRGLVCVRDATMATTCKKYCGSDADCSPPSTCNGEVTDPPFMFCGT